MSRKSKVNKEEICEEVCFHCKDGGLLLVCDYKSCLKAYHPECVGKDESFADTAHRWTCRWHSCFLCHKAAKFQCFCCPEAVCGGCLCDSDFAVIKLDKGLCHHCLKLAVLIEQDLDADSDGGRVDFTDADTVEYLFKSYWQIVKKKEHLSAEQVLSAKKLLKKGKNYACDAESNALCKKDKTYSVSDEESDLQVSDYDGGVESGEEYMPFAKKKRSKGKQSAVKRKVETKKREFIGWASKSLLEFLACMGKDTSKELSQHEVTSMVTDYCREQKLFDPKKKNKVICDATLQYLLGLKSLNKNSIYNRLTSHFADNLEESTDGDESETSSEDKDVSFMSTAKRQVKSSPDVLVVQKSCFASIIPENIKLVYLKRSLIEELLKQPETFREKVTGCFVRVRSDPHDYSQENTHQLLQIKGIKETLRNGGEETEILLQFFSTFKELPVSKLSDDDFCKEECENLHQRVKDGQLKKPTIVELEQKARSLHENITKHWLGRELTLLQKRIDLANEKGWRREYPSIELINITTKLLLETPSEQSRLLNEVPEVIAAIQKCDPTLECTQNQVEEGYNGSSEPAPRESHETHGTIFSNGTSSRTNGSTDPAGLLLFPAGSQLDAVRDLKGAAAKRKRELVPSNCGRSSSMNGFNGDHQRDLGDSKDRPSREEIPTVHKCMQSPCIIPSGQAAELVEPKVARLERMNCQSTSEAKVIELSDGDEDEMVSVTAPALESRGSDLLWYCMGSSGEVRGPYKLSLLKKWNALSSNELKFKVWRDGQSKDEAIFLSDALDGNFTPV